MSWPYFQRHLLAAMSVRFIAGVCLVTVFINPVLADESTPMIEVIPLDSARSHAEFHVHVMWVIPVTGRFGAVNGTISIDHFRSTAQVDARIAADAVKMRDEDYETWVKSAEFFDVEHYPEIHFLSDPFALSRLDTGGEVTGTLEMRGSKQSVYFVLEPSACLGHATYHCPGSAQGQIRRSDFGMHSRRSTLSDKVEIDLMIYASSEVLAH